MAQGSNGKASAYGHFSNSNTSFAATWESPLKTLSNLSFYLSRKVSNNLLTSLGF